jgi:hypothetical protein
MAVSFTTKDDRKELVAVSAKLDDARKENTTLRKQLNNALNAGADSSAVKEKARADAAEASLKQRDRDLAEARKGLKEATAQNDQLLTQLGRVGVVIEKSFDDLKKQLVA